jgi:hypothetical protein
MKFEMKKLAKFPLQPNSKLPACKWTDKSNHLYDISINSNYGIITGKLNNLLVLDTDVKDNGLEEWNKYITRNGEMNTVTVATPSGGLHYYFLYHSKNEANEQLLREHLYTQTKLRGVGLDIRSDGGYVVGPQSTINNKQYEYVNKSSLMEMPTELILWLIEGQNDKKATTKEHDNKVPTVKQSNNDLVFMIDDEKLQQILNKLPKEYNDNYLKWLIVSNVLKGLNKVDIWDSFSKKSKRYNKANNMIIWNSLNSFHDVNYLIRSLDPEPYGGTDARSVCPAENQFAVWKSLWGETILSKTTDHEDYEHCETLAAKIANKKAPTGVDPTGGKTNFRTYNKGVSEKQHPNGIEIAGNFFF